jgi:hypothetical protein
MYNKSIMKKTQAEIDDIKEKMSKVLNDPTLEFACSTFTFCNKCEDWWPCECRESKVMEAFFEKE